jgi:hypothetical protein
MSSASRSSILRRFWKPTAVSGAGGTVAAIWFEEIMLFAETILALLVLPILAGMIYLFNIYLFKTRKPQREDIRNTGDRK